MERNRSSSFSAASRILRSGLGQMRIVAWDISCEPTPIPIRSRWNRMLPPLGAGVSTLPVARTRQESWIEAARRPRPPAK